MNASSQKPQWLLPLIVVGFALLVGVVAYLLYSGRYMAAQNANAVANRYGDFTLTAQSGPMSLSSLKGQVVLIYFGYTYCPDVCPTALGKISLALRALSAEELSKVKVLFITVDPARDTLSRMTEYAAFFHPNIIGLTGLLSEISSIAKRYGVYFQHHSPKTEGGDKADSRVLPSTSLPSLNANYVVDHTGYTYIMSKSGKLANILPHDPPTEDIVAAIRSQLQKSFF